MTGESVEPAYRLPFSHLPELPLEQQERLLFNYAAARATDISSQVLIARTDPTTTIDAWRSLLADAKRRPDDNPDALLAIGLMSTLRPWELHEQPGLDIQERALTVAIHQGAGHTIAGFEARPYDYPLLADQPIRLINLVGRLEEVVAPPTVPELCDTVIKASIATGRRYAAMPGKARIVDATDHWQAAFRLNLDLPDSKQRTQNMLDLYELYIQYVPEGNARMFSNIDAELRLAHGDRGHLMTTIRRALAHPELPGIAAAIDIMLDELSPGHCRPQELAIIVEDLLRSGDHTWIERADRLAEQIPFYAGQEGGQDHRSRALLAVARREALRAGDVKTAKDHVFRLKRRLLGLYPSSSAPDSPRGRQARELAEVMDELSMLEMELDIKSAATSTKVTEAIADHEIDLLIPHLDMTKQIAMQDQARRMAIERCRELGGPAAVANAAAIATTIQHPYYRTKAFVELINDLRRKRHTTAAGSTVVSSQTTTT